MNHCLGLGHDTMVRGVCLTLFLLTHDYQVVHVHIYKVGQY